MEYKTIGQLYDLSGQVAIITGGAVGIGQAIALRLAEARAAVMVADNNMEAAIKTADDIKVKGGQASAVHADVSNKSDAENAILSTIKAFGRLNILVNNAGIYPMTPATDISESEWNRVMDINLKGTFFCSQAAAREIIKAGRGGKMINIASRGGIYPRNHMAHYAASKAGVGMLTKSLALEFAPHKITVNAVAPAVVITPGTRAQVAAVMSGDKSGSSNKKVDPMARIPIGRFGEPDDIAKVVLFLASSASDYMTGSLIMVDGGYQLT